MVWHEAREHCLEFSTVMPEDKYTWKPTEVSKTFAVHIGYTIKLLTQRHVDIRYTKMTEKVTKKKLNTFASLRIYL